MSSKLYFAHPETFRFHHKIAKSFNLSSFMIPKILKISIPTLLQSNDDLKPFTFDFPKKQKSFFPTTFDAFH